MRFRAASRGSALALWQTGHVAELLAGTCGADTMPVVVSTEGDRRAGTPIQQMGGKGVFVKEVQAAVLDGRADFAVHSAKDLPARCPPGLVLAAMFMGYIAAWHLLRRDQRPDPEPAVGFAERLRNARFLIPVAGLVVAVIGSMYLGLATPTEAAAIGVVGALVLAAAQGSLDWTTFTRSLMGAVRTSAMVAFILMGAAFLSLSMGFTGLPRALAEWLAALDLSVYTLIAALTVFYIVIGCFLDGISAVVLTMAVVEPMVNIPAFQEVGFSMIWFGIFVTVVIEMAQITPPIGFNLFVLQSMTHHHMGYVAKTALPMFLIMVLMVVVLVAWPELATWLPDTTRRSPGG